MYIKLNEKEALKFHQMEKLFEIVFLENSSKLNMVAFH